MLYSLWLTLAYLGLTALSFYILYRVVKKAVKSAILESWKYWPGPSPALKDTHKTKSLSASRFWLTERLFCGSDRLSGSVRCHE